MEGRKAAGVLVVSPTYHGICSDLKEISTFCHSHNIPVIVDEAHGAHLGFHPELPSSAIHQGADLVVQSTHKVLCSLTQSSMLHMSGNLVDREKICRCLQTLQSSSPSYLLLASLDAARYQLSENREHVFDTAINLALEAKNMISRIPGVSIFNYPMFSDFPIVDPLRLTIGTWKLGMSGFEADDVLSKEYGVIPELVGTRSITLAFTLGTQREHVITLVAGLKHLSSTYSPTCFTFEINDSKYIAPLNDVCISLSPREAFFAPKQKVDIESSLGKICGELICPYPPGIPALIPGEIITERAINYLLQLRSKGAVISGAADNCLSSLTVCDI